MHFQILVEDRSGKTALDIVVPRIIGQGHTFDVKAYKGIGRLPSGLQPQSDPQKRILLDQLPRLIQGYGKSYAPPSDYPFCLVVVCDLDKRCLKEFRSELLGVLNNCSPMPKTLFCIAVEEGESWLLGDIDAVKAAYPNAKEPILKAYVNDSIVGTWEVLANAVHRDGAVALSAAGWQTVGQAKSQWAERIAAIMDIDNNHSPSFIYFRDKLRSIIQEE